MMIILTLSLFKKAYKPKLYQNHMPQLHDDHGEWSKIDFLKVCFSFSFYFYNSRNKNEDFAKLMLEKYQRIKLERETERENAYIQIKTAKTNMQQP